MKTMGFINSHKENENRIALLPCHMNELGKEAAYMFFERGYASKLGIPDQEYEKMGASISTREEILQKCDIICDLKAGDAEYLGELREGTTIFGWVHPHGSRYEETSAGQEAKGICLGRDAGEQYPDFLQK